MSLRGTANPGQYLTGEINKITYQLITAYGIAVKNGFKGTEEEWLASLQVNNEQVNKFVSEYFAENPPARTNYEQTDSSAVDYLLGKTVLDKSISDAQSSADAAQASADNAQAAADNAQAAADNAQAAADNAQASADNAQTAADNAQDTANGAVAAITQEVSDREAAVGAITPASIGANYSTKAVVSLPAANWSNKQQTVTVTGVTAVNDIFVSCNPSDATVMEEWNKAGVYASAQTADSVTFTCTKTPTVDLSANILILEGVIG